MVYEKVFAIYPTKEFRTGDLINLVESDTSRVHGTIHLGTKLLSLPVLIIACVTLLFMFLGVNFLSGIGFCLICVVITVVLARIFEKL